MNDRQRKFARLVVGGQALGEAYNEAGYKAKGSSAYECASRLARNVKIKEYMDSIREKVEKKDIWSLEERHNMLRRVSDENEDKDPRVSIAAADQYNKLTGGYAPEKVDINQDIVITIGSNSD